MLQNLRIDKNQDNRMDFGEFKAITAERIRSYFNYFIDNYPRLRSRYSKQAWIWHYGAYDNLLEGFHERISRLTMLPHELIEKSEPMQVHVVFFIRTFVKDLFLKVSYFWCLNCMFLVQKVS